MKKTKELLGGQALLEGVMMKGSEALGYAVYAPDGQLITKREAFQSITKRYKFLSIFFVRGFVNLVEMMIIGVRSLNYSVAVAMPEEAAKQSKYEMPLSMLTAFAFSFFLFIVTPATAFNFFKPYIANTILLNLLEGLVRITIFVSFLFLAGLSKEMSRVFGFHGAEHMAVAANEAGEELTVANVQKYSTLHPRCGTSFMLVVFLVSVGVFAFLGRPDLLHRILYKLMLLPFISGVSYELIRFVCRLPRIVMYAVLWPGLLLQKLTTRKPDEKMLTAAIAALQMAKGEV